MLDDIKNDNTGDFSDSSKNIVKDAIKVSSKLIQVTPQLSEDNKNRSRISAIEKEGNL